MVNAGRRRWQIQLTYQFRRFVLFTSFVLLLLQYEGLMTFAWSMNNNNNKSRRKMSSASSVNKKFPTISASSDDALRNINKKNDLRQQLSKQNRYIEKIRTGYKQRIEADGQFLQKSITELFLAASTQFTAEINRRTLQRIIPELDFVVAGILTAMAGKYYSMWRVAPTKQQQDKEKKDTTTVPTSTTTTAEQQLFGMNVPNNAFQSTMLDGMTKPSLKQRLCSLLVPIPSLFRAGVIASLFGYGFTYLLIKLRSVCIPNFIQQTQTVNIIYASIYTGMYMSISSNLRYQILQGIIEPKIIDYYFKVQAKHKILKEYIHPILIVSIRTINNFIGSILALMGMRWLGLQRLK